MLRSVVSAHETFGGFDFTKNPTLLWPKSKFFHPRNGLAISSIRPLT